MLLSKRSFKRSATHLLELSKLEQMVRVLRHVGLDVVVLVLLIAVEI